MRCPGVRPLDCQRGSYRVVMSSTIDSGQSGAVDAYAALSFIYFMFISIQFADLPPITNEMVHQD